MEFVFRERKPDQLNNQNKCIILPWIRIKSGPLGVNLTLLYYWVYRLQRRQESTTKAVGFNINIEITFSDFIILSDLRTRLERNSANSDRKSVMDVVVNSRKEVPKRARQPPKKMILYEADPGSPNKGTKKDIRKKDAAAQKFYNVTSVPQAVEPTTVQQNTASSMGPNFIQPRYQPPSPGPQYMPQYQPPLTHSSPPVQPPLTHSSPPAQPPCQPPLTHSSPPVQPPLTHSSPPAQPQYPPPSFQSNLSPITPLTSSHLEHPQHYQPSNPLQQPPILLDLDQQQNQKIPSSTIAKERFLETLYCPSILKSTSVAPTVESQPSTSENESSSSCSDSSADTYIIERDPIPEYGEPCVATESGNRAWKPCKACRVEVAKLKQEKVTLEQVLCSISGDQLQKARIFLDKVQQIQAQVGVATGSDRQELYPGSGLFLSSTRLAVILAEAKRDCLRLFHLLFDEFFKPEECQNAVAFGKHGKVPEGKAVLEKTKVDAILTYIMHSGSLDGWTPVEKTKVLEGQSGLSAALTVHSASTEGTGRAVNTQTQAVCELNRNQVAITELLRKVDNNMEKLSAGQAEWIHHIRRN
ncbi:uncharacterized protein V6R79_024109 [Siganus canaliculatus]